MLALHRAFVQAGADIILTNSFGANRYRLKLHGAHARVFELNRRAAELAREVADAAGRPVVVAGSMGPTGELFVPLGALTPEAAVEAFAEQGRNRGAGADVCWIETMSAVEEIRAAAEGAIAAGMPYSVTASFDTVGRTMMGLPPADLKDVFEGLAEPPVAFGANCGVGASDLLVSLLAMSAAVPGVLIAKANCGIPQVVGDHVHYSGTPDRWPITRGSRPIPARGSSAAAAARPGASGRDARSARCMAAGGTVLIAPKSRRASARWPRLRSRLPPRANAAGRAAAEVRARRIDVTDHGVPDR